MLDPSQLRQFESEGFLLVPGLLDPKAEIAALDAAYQDLIETLAFVYFAQDEDPAAGRASASGRSASASR